MKPLSTILFLSVVCLASCNTTEKKESSDEPAAATIQTSSKPAKAAPALAQTIEQAHQKTAFQEYAAIQFHLILSFGGRELFDGTISLSTDSGKGLLEHSGSNKIYFSGEKVYVSPDTEQPERLRSSAYTWPYFFMLPYKLSDPGTLMTDYPQKDMNGRTYLTQKLSFAPDTGDAPDDWYILYADEQSSLLQVAAYIVTGGNRSRAEAEKDPHAIEYLDYTEVAGIPIATHWKFWAWRTTEGLTDQLGEATISNITLLKTAGKLFDPPASFKEG